MNISEVKVDDKILFSFKDKSTLQDAVIIEIAPTGHIKLFYPDNKIMCHRWFTPAEVLEINLITVLLPKQKFVFKVHPREPRLHRITRKRKIFSNKEGEEDYVIRGSSYTNSISERDGERGIGEVDTRPGSGGS